MGSLFGCCDCTIFDRLNPCHCAQKLLSLKNGVKEAICNLTCMKTSKSCVGDCQPIVSNIFNSSRELYDTDNLVTPQGGDINGPFLIRKIVKK